MRSVCASLIAALVLTGATADAQPQRQGPGAIIAAGPDLISIPSRITHGVVSVRNAGSVVSPWIIVTVNCHKPDQEGGCPELTPAQYAPYNDPDFPDRLTVNVPPIQPGRVHSHSLSFWSGVTFPTGSYVFDFVADATGAAVETNATNTAETNNAASHTWNKP